MSSRDGARQAPLSPRAVTLPMTPAAPRSNPMDSTANPRSSPTSSKKNEIAEPTRSPPKEPIPSSSTTASRRAGSEAPVSKPVQSSPPAASTRAGSEAPGSKPLDKLARTKSTSSAEAVVEPAPEPKASTLSPSCACGIDRRSYLNPISRLDVEPEWSLVLLPTGTHRYGNIRPNSRTR
jgi:hypothetical protein